MKELNVKEMAMANGGINTDPDELLNATLNGMGAGLAIGAPPEPSSRGGHRR